MLHLQALSVFLKWVGALACILVLSGCAEGSGFKDPLSIITEQFRRTPSETENQQSVPPPAAQAPPPAQVAPGPGTPAPSGAAAPAGQISEAAPTDQAPAPELPGSANVVRRSANPVQAVDVPAVQQEGDTVKIALLLPLSGQRAELGALLLNAAELALFQLGSVHIELLPRDTGGTKEGAARAAQNALASGAQLILGPVFAHSTEAVAPIARLARVKVLAFTTNKQLAGDGVYVMGFTPEEQVERVLQYAATQGLVEVAALVPNTPYGNKVLDTVQESGSQYGIHLNQTVKYSPTAESLSPQMKEAVKQIAQHDSRHYTWQLKKQQLERDVAADPANKKKQQLLETHKELKDLGSVSYQALILPESGARLRAIASLLPHYDIDPADVQLLGTGVWADPSLGREPALQGGWFAAPSLNVDAKFQAAYERAHGVRPPLIASLVYDAVALASVLAPKGIPNYTDQALTNTHGFAGSQGIFRLLPEGVVQHGLAVLELTPDGVKEIDMAPRNFRSFTN